MEEVGEGCRGDRWSTVANSLMGRAAISVGGHSGQNCNRRATGEIDGEVVSKVIQDRVAMFAVVARDGRVCER